MTDLKVLAEQVSSKIWTAWGELVRKNAAVDEHDFAKLILPALQQLQSEFIDTVLEGEARWSKAEKIVLEMLGKGMEYHVLTCKTDVAMDKLNALAKQRWEVVQANGGAGWYYATLKRKRISK